MARSEDDDAAVAQQFGDVGIDDELGQAFDDSGLADASLAEEDGVVLGAPRQHLNDALDLVGPADDRVEFALAGQFGQVAAQSCPGPESSTYSWRRPRSPPPLSGDSGMLCPSRFRTSSRTSSSFRPKFMSTWAATPSCFAQQAEQQVLGADVVVVEVARLLNRVFDDLLGPRGLGQLPHRDHLGAGSGLDDLLDFQADFAEVDVEVLQHVGRDPRPFLHQSEQMCSVPMYSWLKRLALPGWPVA